MAAPASLDFEEECLHRVDAGLGEGWFSEEDTEGDEEGLGGVALESGCGEPLAELAFVVEAE
jgi:hypothetical protein